MRFPRVLTLNKCFAADIFYDDRLLWKTELEFEPDVRFFLSRLLSRAVVAVVKKRRKRRRKFNYQASYLERPVFPKGTLNTTNREKLRASRGDRENGP